jgi:predicted ArsR family transcriptional regulator
MAERAVLAHLEKLEGEGLVQHDGAAYVVCRRQQDATRSAS